MRSIAAADITDAVAALFQHANYELGDDVIAALKNARQKRRIPSRADTLDALLENARIAAADKIPLCQDCGTAVVFLEIGQDVHIQGGDLTGAVNEGVRRAYTQGYLRKSMVTHPFSTRTNTGGNTPAVIHTDIVPGDQVKITVLPKGAGRKTWLNSVCYCPPPAARALLILW